MSSFTRSRKLSFYFQAQNGICYLQITDECRERAGAMVRNRRRSDPRGALATIEHVHPKSAGGGAHQLLAACRACNTEKGVRTDIATSEHFDRALTLFAQWQAHVGIVPPDLTKAERKRALRAMRNASKTKLAARLDAAHRVATLDLPTYSRPRECWAAGTVSA